MAVNCKQASKYWCQLRDKPDQCPSDPTCIFVRTWEQVDTVTGLVSALVRTLQKATSLEEARQMLANVKVPGEEARPGLSHGLE